MKRQKIFTFSLLVLIVTVFSACVKRPEPSNPLLLEFPGTHWNETPEDVRAALGLFEDQILADEAQDADVPEWCLGVTDLECLGDVANSAVFRFIQNPRADHYGLYSVTIYFPEDSDMVAIQGELAELYGPGSAEYSNGYSLEQGMVSENDTAKYVKEGGMYWTAERNGLRDLPQSLIDNLVDFYAQVNDPADEEAVKKWLEREPLARIGWRCDANAELGHTTPNRVIFNGGTYVWLQQCFGETTP